MCCGNLPEPTEENPYVIGEFLEGSTCQIRIGITWDRWNVGHLVWMNGTGLQNFVDVGFGYYV